MEFYSVFFYNIWSLLLQNYIIFFNNQMFMEKLLNGVFLTSNIQLLFEICV